MEILEIISLNWAAGVCLLLGLVFVTIELFTPGFGVPGVTGLVLLFAGIIVASDSVLEGLLLTIITVLLLCVLFMIAVRSASGGALAKSPLVLKESTARQDGFTSGEDMTFFLNKEGEVTAMLRPVGTADFDGVKLEVLSDSGIVEAGNRVRVIKVEGRKIIVTPVK